MDMDAGIEMKWFVAYVHTNTELRTADQLKLLGIESYVPTQFVKKIRKTGRKINGTRKVIPGMVFVKCNEQERRSQVVALPSVLRFLMDRSSIERRVATIPQSEIDLLRFMVGQSEVLVTLDINRFSIGKKVRVLRGSLVGFEGDVVEIRPDYSEITIRLDHLGCAKLSIPTVDLELVDG